MFFWTACQTAVTYAAVTQYYYMGRVHICWKWKVSIFVLLTLTSIDTFRFLFGVVVLGFFFVCLGFFSCSLLCRWLFVYSFLGTEECWVWCLGCLTFFSRLTGKLMPIYINSIIASTGDKSTGWVSTWDPWLEI